MTEVLVCPDCQKVCKTKTGLVLHRKHCSKVPPPTVRSFLRTIAFIDAGQFRPASVSARLRLVPGKRFDWDRFGAFLSEIAGTELFDAHYFDGVEGDSATKQASFHQFLKTVLGFQMHFTHTREKLRSCPECKKQYAEIEQKGVDVNLALAMLKLAYSNAYDQALLCSGDGDFAPLVRHLRESMGKRVIVLGWMNSIAPALRDAAFRTVILNDHLDKIIGDKGF